MADFSEVNPGQWEGMLPRSLAPIDPAEQRIPLGMVEVVPLADVFESDDIADAGAHRDFEHVETYHVFDSFGDLFEVLDDRERLILNLRFGTDTGEPRRAGEVGTIVSLSRSSVHRIESGAIRKLRETAQFYGYENPVI